MADCEYVRLARLDVPGRTSGQSKSFHSRKRHDSEMSEAPLKRSLTNLYATIHDVAVYYDSKTQAILERYGPGPRVHYHAGLVDDEGSADSLSAEELRRQLVAAQERMLSHAA